MNEPPTINHQPPFSEMGLADLIDAFSSIDAVPGGGSAAALAGAVGTSLLIMVAGLPKTKTGAPEETADLAEASSRLHPLRDALLELVDRDSEAYKQVIEAFRLTKETEAERAARKQAIDRAMRAAGWSREALARLSMAIDPAEAPALAPSRIVRPPRRTVISVMLSMARP